MLGLEVTRSKDVDILWLIIHIAKWVYQITLPV